MRVSLARLTAPALTMLPAAARFHGISGYVRRATRGARLPAAVRDELDADYHGALLVHLQALSELQRVQTALHGATDWLVVKGPVLAEMAHGQAGLRTYGDIDLVVPGPQLRTVVERLETAGGRLVDRNWTLIRERLHGELHVLLPAGFLADVHWHLLISRTWRAAFSIPMPELFARAKPVVLSSDLTVRTLAAEDSLLHVALHAALSGGDRLVWHKDVSRLASQDELHWGTVVDRARRWGVQLCVAALLERARDLLAAPVPDWVISELATSPTWRSVLAAADLISPPDRAFGSASLQRMTLRASRRDLPTSLSALARSGTVWARKRGRQGSGLHTEDDPASIVFPSGGPSAREHYFDDVVAEALYSG